MAPRPRRLPTGSQWVLTVAGATGLLLPWMLAPVLSDERYHYAAAPARMNDNLLGVLPWVLNDIQWRMEAGRIAPVGAFEQHVVFLLGMQLAFSSGLPLFVVHGLVKVLLVGAVIGSFVVLLQRLQRPDGAGLERSTKRRMTLVFTVLLILGITTTTPGRNGWTTFVVFCVGGVVLMFLVGAAALWVLHRWDSWRPGWRILSGAGLLAGRPICASMSRPSSTSGTGPGASPPPGTESRRRLPPNAGMPAGLGPRHTRRSASDHAGAIGVPVTRLRGTAIRCAATASAPALGALRT